jgi:phosphopantothenoylcysteine synthetase/decarboxylase
MGKLKSGHENLTVAFMPTQKIIQKINIPSGIKIGFKLEVGLSNQQAETIASDYIKKYNLDSLIVNELKSASSSKHEALAFTKHAADQAPTALSSKTEIANFIARLLEQKN